MLWTFTLKKDPVFFDLPWGVCACVASVYSSSDNRVFKGFRLLLLPSLLVFFAFHAGPGPIPTLRWRRFSLRNLCRSWFWPSPQFSFRCTTVRCRRTCVYCYSGSLKRCLLSHLRITFISPPCLIATVLHYYYLVPVSSVIRTALLGHLHLHVPLLFSLSE